MHVILTSSRKTSDGSFSAPSDDASTMSKGLPQAMLALTIFLFGVLTPGFMVAATVSGLVFLDPDLSLCVKNGPLCSLAIKTRGVTTSPHVHGDSFSGLAYIYGVSYVLICIVLSITCGIMLLRLALGISGVAYRQSCKLSCLPNFAGGGESSCSACTR